MRRLAVLLLAVSASVAICPARSQTPDPFFEANGRRPGVVTLQDGLQYRVLARGSGPRPGDADAVLLTYTGTLLNGTVFGTNRRAAGAAGPEVFAVARLAPGLREAVLRMQVGSRWKVYVPTRLGFGRGKGFPQQRPLIYDVELAGILPEPVAAQDRLEAGRRIFEEGILPSGQAVVATLEGAVQLRGSQAACAACHRRSGYGAAEGRIVVPAITGPALFSPGVFASVTTPGDRLRHEGRQVHVHRSLARSAYDEASLERAIRQGVDPDGIALSAPMPRFELDRPALRALAAYLRTLSAFAPPGLYPDRLELATVVTPDASAAARAGVEQVLRHYGRSRPHGGPAWHIHVWELNGAPAGWREQLARAYRKEPVFAILSGAGRADWEPVQEFCEQMRLPCLFPSLDRLPQRTGAYYSLYFSAGAELEAQTLAEASSSPAAASQWPSGRWIQVAYDAAGAAAARALRVAWPVAGTEFADRPFDPAAPVAALGAVDAGDALVLWLRPDEVRALVDAAGPNPPAAGAVFLSETFCPPDEIRLPPAWKARTHFLSPLDPKARQRSLLTFEPWLRSVMPPTQGARRAKLDAYAAAQLFSNALGAMAGKRLKGVKGEASREFLLEVLESVGTVFRSEAVPQYRRMSLGPGQRIAVKRGSVTTFGSIDDDSPEAVEFGEEG